MPITRIAFGSCAEQSSPQAVWNAVVDSNPDVFIFLGDNVYGDTEDPAELRGAYEMLGANEGYQQLLEQSEVIATWDDHDYGENDAGREYPMKAQSKEIFLDFFNEPEGTERRTRDGGIYTSYTYGPAGQRVQIILLDTRWARSPINEVSDAEYEARQEVGAGPYTATTGPDARMLSEAQWTWLEETLREPAELHIIGTSIPFLQDGTGWETWANFPDEKGRMVDLIQETGANGTFFITGDTHWAQFSKRTSDAPYPLWEVNSSGLTENWESIPPDANRLGDVYFFDNYGLLSIDWDAPDPEVTMEIRAVDGDLVMQNTVRLSELQMAQTSVQN